MPFALTFAMCTSPMVLLSALAAVEPNDPATSVEALYFRNSRRFMGTSLEGLALPGLFVPFLTPKTLSRQQPAAMPASLSVRSVAVSSDQRRRGCSPIFDRVGLTGRCLKSGSSALIPPTSGHIAASHHSANLLTKDEARRIAANAAKLP